MCRESFSKNCLEFCKKINSRISNKLLRKISTKFNTLQGKCRVVQLIHNQDYNKCCPQNSGYYLQLNGVGAYMTNYLQYLEDRKNK